VWGLLLVGSWKATMGRGASKGVGFCCKSARRGGGIGMEASSVGDCTGEEDGKCGLVSQRVSR